MNIRKVQLFLGFAITFLLGFLFGTYKVNFYLKNYNPYFSFVGKEPSANLGNVDMTRFYAVWDKLAQLYYDKKVLNPNKMLNGAINGMVASLGDPFTLYLAPSQNQNFQEQLAGQFQGIGAELTAVNGKIMVIAPLDGSPAKKAGIKAGDEILKVNGVSTASWDINKAVSAIRGHKDTTVTLTVLHKSEKTPIDIKVTRNIIIISSVEGWIKPVDKIANIKTADFKNQDLKDKIVYIRLSQFGDGTNKDWSKLVFKLKSEIQKESNVKGLVLDLRDNPGGYLTDAVFIAGEFLPQGAIVVKEDNGISQSNLQVDKNGQFLNIPLVVLINGGSASASEIVSGALRDNKRALLVGEKSFGKGTVQEALDLGEGAGLHVTIAKWLTPNGIWVNKVGLIPDVVINFNAKNLNRDTQLEKAIQTLLK